MKLTQYMAALCVPFLALTACETDIDQVVFNPETATPATLSVEGTQQDLYTLDASNASANVFTLNWTAPDMGLQVAVTNALQMDIDGHDFANAQQLVTETERANTSYTAVASDLNAYIQTLLAGYGMETPTAPEDALTLSFRLISFISSSSSDTLYSDVLNLRVLPYEGEAVYPSISVRGSYNGWNWGNCQKLYSPNDDHVYTGMIYFDGKAQEGWKFCGAEDWSVDNWGIGAEAVTEGTNILTQGGGDIKVYSHNSYWMEFNNQTGELKVSQAYDSWGIVGNHNGWGSGDTKMTLAMDENNEACLTATLDMPASNTWKIRPDEKWENDKGPSQLAFEGDVADNGDGNFIANEAGSYTIKWYFNKVEQKLVVTKN